MRIALIAPFSRGAARGNITTVSRIAGTLESIGITTLVLPADQLPLDQMARRLAEFKPDLIHAFHARHGGTSALLLAQDSGLPVIITITGSDIHDQATRTHPDTVRAVTSARGIICFSALEAGLLDSFFPHRNGAVTIIPQGISPLPDYQEEYITSSDTSFILLLPAALRPVKRVELAIHALQPLISTCPQLSLIIVGGVIDADYADEIRRLLAEAPFASWPGEVPHHLMGGLYRRADLVLNCSSSESMSNSLMEAMVLGRPVLAADIPGNRSLVQDGVTGWLFNSEASLRKLVYELAHDPPRRQTIAEQARHHMQTCFSPQQEAERHLAVYRSFI